MRKILVVGTLIVLTFLIFWAMAGCGKATPTPSPSPSATVEMEEPDCDFDDIVERDSDCGFTKSSPKPVVKTPPRQPAPPQPAPRKTKG